MLSRKLYAIKRPQGTIKIKIKSINCCSRTFTNMGEASDLPPEGIHLLRLDDIPPDLKRWFEPLANPQQAQDGSYASMAKKSALAPITDANSDYKKRKAIRPRHRKL